MPEGEVADAEKSASFPLLSLACFLGFLRLEAPPLTISFQLCSVLMTAAPAFSFFAHCRVPPSSGSKERKEPTLEGRLCFMYLFWSSRYAKHNRPSSCRAAAESHCVMRDALRNLYHVAKARATGISCMLCNTSATMTLMQKYPGTTAPTSRRLAMRQATTMLWKSTIIRK